MSEPLKTWWIVRGTITCPDVAAMRGQNLGDTEWQFSDGPVGERGYSDDFATLEEGLAYLCPAIFIWDRDNDQK